MYIPARRRGLVTMALMANRQHSTTESPLRLLCLHGWRTNAALMELQTRQLRAQFADGEAEFVHLNGPHESPSPAFPGAERLVDKPFYEWWDTVEEGGSSDAAYGFSSDATRVTYRGLCDSLDFLRDYLRDDYAASGRPFDAIIGFSQGGIMATILTALLERQRQQQRHQEQPEVPRGGWDAPVDEARAVEAAVVDEGEVTGTNAERNDWLQEEDRAIVPDMGAAWKMVVLVSSMMPRDTRLTANTRAAQASGAQGSGGVGSAREVQLMGLSMLATPSFHVFGEADVMAPKSRELAAWWGFDCFHNAAGRGGELSDNSSSTSASSGDGLFEAALSTTTGRVGVVTHDAGHKFPPGNRKGEYRQIKNALLFHCRGQNGFN
jgi:predicted esterase